MQPFQMLTTSMHHTTTRNEHGKSKIIPSEEECHERDIQTIKGAYHLIRISFLLFPFTSVSSISLLQMFRLKVVRQGH